MVLKFIEPASLEDIFSGLEGNYYLAAGGTEKRGKKIYLLPMILLK